MIVIDFIDRLPASMLVSLGEKFPWDRGAHEVGPKENLKSSFYLNQRCKAP